MRFRTLLTPSLLSSLLPLTSHAQTALASSRFYVGVGATMYSDLPFNDRGIVPRLLGPSLTAGMAFTPRLARQAGLSHHWEKDSYPYRFSNSPDATVLIHSTYFIVPVLLRYSLTAPAERLHFDALGGVTLVYAASHVTYESNGPLDPALKASGSSDTRFALALGPAARTAISPHLELTAASLVSMVVGETYYRFRDRFFLTTSLGVNYTFGQRL